METVVRIFEEIRAVRVAAAAGAGAVCAEAPEGRESRKGREARAGFARRTPFSVEMFPPKGQLTLDAARDVVEGLRAASPDFISVTCSAGGSGNGH